MNILKNKNKFGFTVIEILVIIVVISIIASIVMANVRQVQRNSRDAKRKTDIKQIMKALELYYADNGQYPTGGWWDSEQSDWSSLQNYLRPYLSSLPVDPINNDTANGPPAAGTYSYNYYGNVYGCTGQWYMLVYRLENPDITSPGASSCAGKFNYSGTITVGNCYGSLCTP